MMKVWRLVLLIVLVTPGLSRAQDYYALVVSGAAGDPTYHEVYTAWRQSLVDGLRAQPGFRDDHLFVLAATPGPGIGRASTDGVGRAFSELRRRMTAESVLLVVLIGHGTDDGVDPKFNLVGPDLAAREWSRLLDGLPGRTVFVNTTASSFPFVAALARPGRVVITATASPVQRFDTVFPRFFVDVLDDPAADGDKDGRVSVWEAFTASSARVRRYYQGQGRLATERALLDDSGDGIGADAELGAVDVDGHRAALMHVGAGVGPPKSDSDPALAPLVTQRDALQEAVAGLKARKRELAAAEYQRELERLLVDLARVSRQIRDAMQEL